MKITKKVIPYINPAYLCAGILIAGALILTGCANSGGSHKPVGGQASADSQHKQECKAAIDDVTRFCSGDKASTGKCNDAKAKTRELCIDSN